MYYMMLLSTCVVESEKYTGSRDTRGPCTISYHSHPLQPTYIGSLLKLRLCNYGTVNSKFFGQPC